jgi:predicted ATP-grasp superfamily ATP-dependent carboligase
MNLLVLSSTASAINYQKTLGSRSDLRVFMTDASTFAGGLYAPGVTPIVIPRGRDQARYRESLDRIIAENKIDALIPTSDHDVEGVMELLHDGWNPPVRMFNPDYEVYRTLSHKANLMHALEKKGLRTIPVYRSADEAEFPAVVKPARECGSKGVWIVNSRKELADRLAILQPKFGDDLVIQEFIPGETGSIYIVLLLYGHDGKLHGEAASHSHLTFMTWGGGGNAGVLVDEPELLEQAKEMVAKLGGWRGPINLEFKRSSKTGLFYPLEVNCRLNGYSYLYTMNGLDYPGAIIDLLKGKDPGVLQLNRERELKTFVIGFREKPVERWVS